METESSATAGSSTLPSGDWHVDPARSRVHFNTRAMFGLFPVRGRFEKFDGVLHVDDSGKPTGDLRIEAASIQTGIRKRDAHLRTADFFHADAHPYLTFNLTGAERDGDSHEVSGTLHIRDKTVPVRARATVGNSDTEIRIQTRFPVDHDAAGLGWAKPGMVRKVVDADIELVLARQDHTS